MAHHGGPTSLPRAHRPRAPIMSVPAPLTAPLAPLRTTAATSTPTTPSATTTTGATTSVTLAAPRPETERTSNEYVETPFRPTTTLPPAAASPPPPPRVARPPARPAVLPPPPLPPVTKQPATAASFSKEPSLAAAECNSRQSIICAECGNCRCLKCQQPRPLPECWLCNNKYLCSADTVIDYASCLCCVKGLFYHCSESDGGASCADNPCACGPDRRRARWGCLAALSCVLPCLWFYWPLQCGKRAVEACYARHSRQGCRCRPKSTTTTTHALNTPEKRLLDASPDF